MLARAGAAFNDYWSAVKYCDASAGGYSYSAAGQISYSLLSSTTRRWDTFQTKADSGTQMGGSNKFTHRIYNGSTKVYDHGPIGDFAKDVWFAESPVVNTTRANSEGVHHAADMDAVLAYRAKCTIYWTY